MKKRRREWVVYGVFTIRAGETWSSATLAYIGCSGNYNLRRVGLRRSVNAGAFGDDSKAFFAVFHRGSERKAARRIERDLIGLLFPTHNFHFNPKRTPAAKSIHTRMGISAERDARGLPQQPPERPFDPAMY